MQKRKEFANTSRLQTVNCVSIDVYIDLHKYSIRRIHYLDLMFNVIFVRFGNNGSGYELYSSMYCTVCTVKL